MKVLVAYFTQTGNTEQIAKAIHEEVSKRHEVQLRKVEELSPEECKGYDWVFIGSPIHGGNLAGAVATFIGDSPQFPGFKFVGFVTHFADAYSKRDFEGTWLPLRPLAKIRRLIFEDALSVRDAWLPLCMRWSSRSRSLVARSSMQ